MNKQSIHRSYPYRRSLIVLIFIFASSVLIWRAYYLQISNNEFLRNHGDARSLRIVKIPAHRGIITDRNNEPLAISTPVDSVWATPKQVLEQPDLISALASILEMEPNSLLELLVERKDREFVYLKRHVSPDVAKQVENLEIVGVNLQQEFKRYYPAGEVTAHIVGFNNVDDTGQEGIELAYEKWLKGVPGEKRVLKDRLGRIIRDVESIKSPSPGKNLILSIDRRVQYLAYRELATAVNYYKARSGSLVLLDPNTGEVLALAVQPTYNPNNRAGLISSNFRNRAITDVFEPGSTLKPFTIAAGLMSGLFQVDTIVQTSPGYLRVSNHVISDISNYGPLDLPGIIQKSSNVGASKIGLAIGPESLWSMYRDVGFGEQTGSGFPGESPGILSNYSNLSELDLASISFGHGMAVTALQLARAYAVIASNGILNPVTFIKTDKNEIVGEQVLSPEITSKLMMMLEKVVQPGGTGQKASVPFYRVIGKTGTAHKSTSTGYAEDRYLSLFAGIAPASNPRLVLAVIIDEPQGGEHYGGQVAAPVFSKVIQGALRILNIPPDNISDLNSKVSMAVKKPGITDQLR
ncbi:MAG: cell division protein FtsI (penicillin-binding protein 3) [Gammaproteobacteria bacterium]|jgi:cell division protein FtsI (penicillin-binding protein 3)